MSLVVKRLWNLSTLARATVCTRRSAISHQKTKLKKSLKCNSASSTLPKSHNIQYRCYSSPNYGVHQRTLIREWNNIGYELLDQNRYDEALEAFNKVLATDATNIRATTGKALVSLKLKKFEVALECLDRLLDSDEPSAYIFTLRGSARCNLGQYAAALKDFLRARKLEPERDSKAFWEDIGVGIDDFGPRTIEFCKHALKRLPTEPHLYHMIATSYIFASNFAEAKEYASQAIERDHNDAKYHLALARAEFGLGNWKLASLGFDKVIRMGTANNLEYLWVFKAEAEFNMGNYNEMEHAYYQAFEHLAEPTDALLQNAAALAHKFYKEFNQPERAMKLLEKIVKYNTINVALLLAGLYTEFDRYNDAVKLLRDFHEKNPANTLLKYNFAVLLEPSEALPYLEQVVQAKDAFPYSWKALGEVYYKLGQYENAVAALDKSENLFEDLYQYYQIKTDCYFNLRQYDNEYQVVRKMCELMPNGPLKYYSALPHIVRGEYNKALVLVNEFLAQQPEVADAWNVRATILKELGQQEEAFASIDKAEQGTPHPAFTYQRIDMLGTFGRFDEAHVLVKQSEANLATLSDDFKHVIHNLTLSVLLRRQARYEESLAYADKAIENIDKLNPDLFRFQIWVEKAKLLTEMNRTDEAIANYEYALKICPEEPYSLLHLAKLYRLRGRVADVQTLLPRLAEITADSDAMKTDIAEILTQNGLIR